MGCLCGKDRFVGEELGASFLEHDQLNAGPGEMCMRAAVLFQASGAFGAAMNKYGAKLSIARLKELGVEELANELGTMSPALLSDAIDWLADGTPLSITSARNLTERYDLRVTGAGSLDDIDPFVRPSMTRAQFIAGGVSTRCGLVYMRIVDIPHDKRAQVGKHLGLHIETLPAVLMYIGEALVGWLRTTYSGQRRVHGGFAICGKGVADPTQSVLLSLEDAICRVTPGTKFHTHTWSQRVEMEEELKSAVKQRILMKEMIALSIFASALEGMQSFVCAGLSDTAMLNAAVGGDRGHHVWQGFSPAQRRAWGQQGGEAAKEYWKQPVEHLPTRWVVEASRQGGGEVSNKGVQLLAMATRYAALRGEHIDALNGDAAHTKAPTGAIIPLYTCQICNGIAFGSTRNLMIHFKGSGGVNRHSYQEYRSSLEHSKSALLSAPDFANPGFVGIPSRDYSARWRAVVNALAKQPSSEAWVERRPNTNGSGGKVPLPANGTFVTMTKGVGQFVVYCYDPIRSAHIVVRVRGEAATVFCFIA
jgi:hypothetical protein